MVSWTHPEKAVSRLNSDALVTQLPSSSRKIHEEETKKRSEAQAELAKIEDELKQALLQAGQKV